MDSKVTFRKDEQYGIVIQKDGKDMFCPYQSAVPIPMQTSMGGMSINLMRMPCSSQCPFAEFLELDGLATYTISCGKDKITFRIDKQDKAESTILKLV